jgi:hypothetical protein
MTENDIIYATHSLKTKNYEGYDRLPPKMLYNVHDILSSPFARIFQKLYEQKEIPDQLNVSKIMLVFQKGIMIQN